MRPGLLRLTTESPRREHTPTCTKRRHAHMGIRTGTGTHKYKDTNRQISLSLSHLHIAETDKQIHICFLKHSDKETLIHLQT